MRVREKAACCKYRESAYFIKVKRYDILNVIKIFVLKMSLHRNWRDGGLTGAVTLLNRIGKSSSWSHLILSLDLKSLRAIAPIEDILSGFLSLKP